MFHSMPVGVQDGWRGWMYVFGVGIVAGIVFRPEPKGVSARATNADAVVAR